MNNGALSPALGTSARAAKENIENIVIKDKVKTRIFIALTLPHSLPKRNSQGGEAGFVGGVVGSVSRPPGGWFLGEVEEELREVIHYSAYLQGVIPFTNECL